VPRLISQLFESEIFIQIGTRHFQIPRDLFSSPGDSPNFFSLGFAVFFAAPNDVFPGLNHENLLRPPSILPPSVPNRSAEVFAELVQLLRGYPLHIRDEEHRQQLLRDCRYFHLRGLEQKLIPHQISFNLERNRSEIAIRLEDIRQSGVSFLPDPGPSSPSPSSGWVQYARPFADDTPRELILEISGETTKIDFKALRAEFIGQSNARISSLFQVIANKLNLPTTQPLGLVMISGGLGGKAVSPGNTGLSEDKVKIRIGEETAIVLDGEPYSGDKSEFGASVEVGWDSELAEVSAQTSPVDAPAPTASGATPTPSNAGITSPSIGGSFGGGVSRPGSTKPGVSFGNVGPSQKKRKRRGSLDEFGEWIVKRGLWRLRVQSKPDGASGMEIVLVAVKMDAISGEAGRNASRDFLGL
jgi:hypothetical protein